MGVKVYGASDDLIEVDGDIREEFGYHYSESDPTTKYLSFSDGTVIRVRYGEADEYGWSLKAMADGTDSAVTHIPATSEDNYSDMIEIEDVDIRWVVIGDQFVRARP
jgi:hypothetical protein